MKKFLESLKSSGREILFCVLMLSGFAFMADAAAKFAAESSFGLVNLIALFAGVAKFGAVMLTVWVFGIAVSFPHTISEFINKRFNDVWDNQLSDKAKFFTCLGVAGGLGLIAVLCFL